MKCPKCGYLGFETTDQCRNCGYDFSLAVRSDTPTELPLRSSDTPESPLADFEFGDRDVAHETSATTLDLDRVIGAPPSAPDRPRFTRGRARVAVATPPGAGAAGATRAAESTGAADASGTSGPHTASELPLFGAGPTELDDTPLITSPRPVRPPLSVRRATPDIVRGRPRSSRAPLPRDESSELALQLDGPAAVAESA